MSAGTIIVLNGTSSAGKSTIAAAIQELAPVPYIHTGVDHVLERVPRRYFVPSDGINPSAAEGWLLVFRDGRLVEAPRIGPLGYRVLDGMYRAVAGLAAAGNQVIVDDVIYDERVLGAAAMALREARVLLVGVRCPRAVAEQRERERGNRAPGGAAIFDALVHRHGIYDLEVDSAALSADECAGQILACVERGGPWTAMQRLREGIMAAAHARP